MYLRIRISDSYIVYLLSFFSLFVRKSGMNYCRPDREKCKGVSMHGGVFVLAAPFRAFQCTRAGSGSLSLVSADHIILSYCSKREGRVQGSS